MARSKERTMEKLVLEREAYENRVMEALIISDFHATSIRA